MKRSKTFTKELDKQSKIHNEQLEYFEKKQLENRSTIQKLQNKKDLLLYKIDTLIYVPIPNANLSWFTQFILYTDCNALNKKRK